MSILTDAQIDAIRHKGGEGYEPREGRYDFSPLRTHAEIFGYCIEVARREGWDQVELIERCSRSRRLIAKISGKSSGCCVL